ncbi:MAG: winged helix-turn-helix domain-containing protein [Proteobacteria bacterium]|jgi:hypothetical protein|nr:winged helix-turn-helix domain-containing protein [Pseudomonadota bacterium]
MLAPNSDHVLEQAVDRIKRSGALGRSPAYQKLLDYLAECTSSGAVCSEMTLAIDVFHKGEDFDVTTDSSVRVYIYKLRQKLEAYYDGPGSHDDIRLSIPKGTYRLVVEQVVERAQTNQRTTGSNSYFQPYMATLLPVSLGVICIVLLAVIFLGNERLQDEVFSQEQQLFWGSLLSDDKPVMIVVGDYYIFGETTDDYDIRLVREFDINSESDLRQALILSEDAEFPDNRFDVGLTYLPRGSAYAISRVQEILQRTDKNPRITMMSEFSAEDLRSNHVIYIGYISGLGVLENYTFSASQFGVGYSYDELIDIETGESYVSDFIEAEDNRNFVDYGLIASFSVAESSQIVILSGTRDAGLMEMSELAIAPNILARMELEAGENRALMAVFEVYGFNLTNISGHLIGSEYLDASRAWGE